MGERVQLDSSASNSKTTTATAVAASAASASAGYKDGSTSTSSTKKQDEQEEKKSFEESASFISFFFVAYLDKLLLSGRKQTLEHDDLGCVSKQDQCSRIYQTFDSCWKAESSSKRQDQISLNRSLWRSVGYSKFVLGVSLYAIYTVGGIVPIMIMNALVKHFEGVDRLSTTKLWFFVVGLFVIPMLASGFAAQSNIIFSHSAVQFRNALVDKIFRKAMLLSPTARQQTSAGEIINIFSIDTRQIMAFLFFLNQMMLSLPTIVVCLYLIYNIVGNAIWIGLCLILIGFPINFCSMMFIRKCRAAKLRESDKRTKLMSEILNGIRIIKYYAWENAFQSKVLAVRKQELIYLRRIAYTVAVFFTLSLQAVPVFLPVVTFYAYLRFGGNLSTAKTFTAISYFNMLSFPFIFLPLGLSNYIQMLVSCKRVINYLCLEELQQYVTKVGRTLVVQDIDGGSPQSAPTGDGDGDDDDAYAGVVIRLVNATLAWKKQDALIAAADSRDPVLSSSSSSPAAISTIESAPKYKLVATTNIGNAGQEDDVEMIKIMTEGEEEEEEERERRRKDEGVGDDDNNQQKERQNNSTKEKFIGDGSSKGSDSGSCSVFMLKELNISISRGELVAIVGSVGSGKSSLLSALLGEMIIINNVENREEIMPSSSSPSSSSSSADTNAHHSVVQMTGSVAYCDQKPWILNDTVKSNILFGKPYDEKLFDATMHAAHLEDDVKILPGGVQTQIGERGINLSGGQKARVALGRALYANADIYLLDDVMSAVDAHVGQFIFDEFIMSALVAAGKTVLLVTHNVSLLSRCDKVIVMQEGSILGVGSLEQLEQRGIDVKALLPANRDKTISAENSEVTTAAENTSVRGKKQSGVASLGAVTDTKGESVFHSRQETSLSPAVEQQPNSDMTLEREKSRRAAAARRLDDRKSTITSKEEKNEGSVRISTYLTWMRAGGLLLFIGILVFALFMQAFQVLSLFWLSRWGTVSLRKSEDGGSGMSAQKNLEYLNIYAALGALALSCYAVRAIFQANHRMRLSIVLHEKLLSSVLSCPVGFFDVTPIGRIISRFSQDLAVIDQELSMTAIQLINAVTQCFAAVCAVSVATKGTFLLLVIPISYFYNWIQKVYRAGNTAVARCESVSRSPIYTDFNQVLLGMSSLKAFKAEGDFIHRLEQRVDRNTIALMTSHCLTNWLAIRLDFISAVIALFIAVLAVASEKSGFIPAGSLALGLVYAFQLATYLKYLIQMYGQLEAQMNAVERITYYCDELKHEKIGGKDEKEDDEADEGKAVKIIEEDVPANWPLKGHIKGEKICLRYGSDGPLILKDVSFDIQSTEKIGIVGRTGSGKSSLFVGLFRIEELASGSITVDGLDLSRIPLHTLRSRIGIIPQEPVMFSATVRFNLDPFDQYTDQDIWDVLESVQMKSYVSSLPLKLSELVSEGGDNLSLGQRQLCCIARALLRKPKLLLLDEATASIDNETDELIQHMIKERFKGCTVLTIAHRLGTVIDADRIMVFHDGELVEMDTPSNLLNNPENASECTAGGEGGGGRGNESMTSSGGGTVNKSVGVFKGLWEAHEKNLMNSPNTRSSNATRLSSTGTVLES